MNAVLRELERLGELPRGRFESRKLLDLAADAPCMHCGGERGTVVAAHANSQAKGKGAGEKAHDCFIAFLGHRCHAWLDQGRGPDPTGVFSDSREDKAMVWQRAADATLLYLFKTGKVRVS